MKIPSPVLILAVGLAGAGAFPGCGSVGGEVDDGGYYGPGVYDAGFYGDAWYGAGGVYGHPRGYARGDDHRAGARPASAPPMPHQARPAAAPRGGGGAGESHGGSPGHSR